MNFQRLTEDQLDQLAAALARALGVDGCVFHLSGDLGAGKTRFTRGLLRAMGHRGAVRSPTYTLLEPYEFDKRSVMHMDLYRLTDPEELEFIGIRDLFDQQSIVLIEWPERAEGFLPAPDVDVLLEVDSATTRNVRIEACSSRGQTLLESIKNITL